MDQVAEFDLLRQANDIIDIESHAHTHMSLHVQRWLQAPDKYSNKVWYRELYDLIDERDLHDEETKAALKHSAEKITAWFGKAPTSLVPPGHKLSQNTFRIAGAMGFRLLAMNTVFVLQNGAYAEAAQIHNPDLAAWAKFDTSLISAGFPAIGYFHDRDVVLNGTNWLRDCLAGWRERGVRRFITFRELAGLLTARVHANVETDRISGFVDIAGTGGVGDDYRSRYFAEHSFPLRVRLPNGRRVQQIFIEEQRSGDYATAEGEVIMKLPPFQEATRKHFDIQFYAD
jgi:hypothetical protein